jgi:type I restriction enzyme R subunit
LANCGWRRSRIAQLTEDYLVEQPAIQWLTELGYLHLHGSSLSPENKERGSYREVVLRKHFVASLKKLNPWLNEAQVEDVYQKVVDIDHPDFTMKSKMFYEMLATGVKVVVHEDQEERTRLAKLVDFDNPTQNEFLGVNQFPVEYQYQVGLHRRPDLVVFVNGLPLVIFEFKSFNANETAKDAFDDLDKKAKDIPQLYVYAQFLVASDGSETKYGSKTSGWDRFFVWEGIHDDDDIVAKRAEDGNYEYFVKATGQKMASLEIMLRGLFPRENLLEYLQDFVYYEQHGETIQIKIAMYHQFYVVRKAIERTRQAILFGKTPEDRRIGVVWHTQGSGKSLTMLFYARKIMKVRELEYPLLLFITDRNNLDEQLSDEFASLPIAKQVESIRELQETIRTSPGGIVFATIQKFGKKKSEDYPLLTNRKNIIIIADEAHRSHYKDFAENLRDAVPNASFMGFTATPIEYEDRSTTLVFGDHISIYSMDKAIRHGVIVPIFYDARLSKLHLANEFIDEDYEEISESVTTDPTIKESLKKKFATLEELIMADERLDAIAEDIVKHFTERTADFNGKAIIVTISRKVAVKLYEKIVKLKNAPSVVVVMSGSRHDDPEEFWPHIRERKEQESLADDFKNPTMDPQVAIVVDMWLTGFDAPCLNTMYFDKPMKDHSLIQAIARVNRVFKDKPGGLIVDYIGIADDLRKSLAKYTLETIQHTLTNIQDVLKELKEKHDIVSSMFHGIDYHSWREMKPEEVSTLTALSYDRISKDADTKKRFVRNFVAMKKLYVLACPHPETGLIKDDIIFFEMIKKMIVKYSTAKVRDITRELEYEMSELISRSIRAEEPIDVFALAGKSQAEISIFDERFISELKTMPYKNYAAELLAKVAKDQLVVRMKINPRRYKTLYDMLTKLIDQYNVKLITAPEVIEQLIEIANDIKKQLDEGRALNLSEPELSFYDMLSSKKTYFENLKQVREVVKEIVKELSYYSSVPDWDRKEYLKAKIRIALKGALMKAIDGRASYSEIGQLSTDVMDRAVAIYPLEQELQLPGIESPELRLPPMIPVALPGVSVNTLLDPGLMAKWLKDVPTEQLSTLSQGLSERLDQWSISLKGIPLDEMTKRSVANCTILVTQAILSNVIAASKKARETRYIG